VRLVEPAAFTKVSALGVEEQRVNVILDAAGLPQALGDGYRVDVGVVVADAADVAKVPASSVFRTRDGHAVFVVGDRRARLRAVVVGLSNRDDAHVTQGLAPGEAVVRYPTSALRDGSRVRERE
jgi:HlyD family secretion protein